MARLQAVANALYYPTPPGVAAAIARHLAPADRLRPGHVIRALDPCAGTGAALARLTFSDEIRRRQDAAGGVSIVARLSGAEAAALRAGPDLRVESLSLEDLFVEVTQ